MSSMVSSLSAGGIALPRSSSVDEMRQDDDEESSDQVDDGEDIDEDDDDDDNNVGEQTNEDRQLIRLTK